MLNISAKVEEVFGCDPFDLPDAVLRSTEPLVLRGLVAHWPVVQSGLHAPRQALADIGSFYQGRPVSAFLGDPDIHGRFFYNEELTGFNFTQLEARLDDVLGKLLEYETAEKPPALYIAVSYTHLTLPTTSRV